MDNPACEGVGCGAPAVAIVECGGIGDCYMCALCLEENEIDAARVWLFDAPIDIPVGDDAAFSAPEEAPAIDSA